MSEHLRSRRLGNHTKNSVLTSSSSYTEAGSPRTASTSTPSTATMSDPDDPRAPLLAAKRAVPATLSERHSSSTSAPLSPDLKDNLETSKTDSDEMDNLSKKSQWIALALASGACAAFNGVFAKLTTTELTTNFATGIANFIGLSSVEGGVEVVVRASFFALNLLFNLLMWTLFTRALTAGSSTVRVAILNTSSNFLFTAILGYLIFKEQLPKMWFLGAAMLVAGNVIIGRRDEGEGEGEGARAEEGGVERGGEQGEGLLGGNEEVELESAAVRKGGDEEDLLDLEGESETEADRERRIGPEALRRDW